MAHVPQAFIHTFFLFGVHHLKEEFTKFRLWYVIPLGLTIANLEWLFGAQSQMLIPLVSMLQTYMYMKTLSALVIFYFIWTFGTTTLQCTMEYCAEENNVRFFKDSLSALKSQYSSLTFDHRVALFQIYPYLEHIYTPGQFFSAKNR